MSKSNEQNAALPATAAAGLLAAGAASHHALSGFACAVVVFSGLLLRARPGRRLMGDLLLLSGAVLFCVALLFGTGYSLGGDMAARDAARPGAE